MQKTSFLSKSVQHVERARDSFKYLGYYVRRLVKLVLSLGIEVTRIINCVIRLQERYRNNSYRLFIHMYKEPRFESSMHLLLHLAFLEEYATFGIILCHLMLEPSPKNCSSPQIIAIVKIVKMSKYLAKLRRKFLSRAIKGIKKPLARLHRFCCLTSGDMLVAGTGFEPMTSGL